MALPRQREKAVDARDGELAAAHMPETSDDDPVRQVRLAPQRLRPGARSWGATSSRAIPAPLEPGSVADMALGAEELVMRTDPDLSSSRLCRPTSGGQARRLCRTPFGTCRLGDDAGAIENVFTASPVGRGRRPVHDVQRAHRPEGRNQTAQFDLSQFPWALTQRAPRRWDAPTHVAVQ